MHITSCSLVDAPFEGTVIVDSLSGGISSAGAVNLTVGMHDSDGGCRLVPGIVADDSDVQQHTSQDSKGRVAARHAPPLFHSDFGVSKGLVAARYAPSLAQCGCYEISEWHPGRRSVGRCDGYLSPSVPMQIVDALGVNWRLLVDQSSPGDQWNSLGHFELSAGLPDITSSNEGTDDCYFKTGFRTSCYYLVGALKLEWRARSCSDILIDVPSNMFNSSATNGSSTRSRTVMCSSSSPSMTLVFVAACLGMLYLLALMLWGTSTSALMRRLRQAQRQKVQTLYFRPDAWPMCVANPGGDHQLTVPVEPVPLPPPPEGATRGFTQMGSPYISNRARTSSLRFSDRWTTGRSPTSDSLASGAGGSAGEVLVALGGLRIVRRPRTAASARSGPSDAASADADGDAIELSPGGTGVPSVV